MRLVVVILGAVVALAAGGGIAWWLLLRDDPRPALADAAAQAQAHAPSYLEVDPLDIPVIENGEVIQRITFVVQLDLMPGADRKTLWKEMPRIRDTLYTELHSLYSMRIVRDLDNSLPLIKRRLREAANRALGGDKVADVLIGEVNKRNLASSHLAAANSRNTRGPYRLTP